MTGFNENSFGQITLLEDAFEAEGPSWLNRPLFAGCAGMCRRPPIK